jgi:hypothetical protein
MYMQIKAKSQGVENHLLPSLPGLRQAKGALGTPAAVSYLSWQIIHPPRRAEAEHPLTF